jgi:2'-5' RNA ligase
MRAFIAVPCPDEAKTKLAQVSERVKSMGDLKAVEKENIHLTLRFLGDIEEGTVEDTIAALSSVKRPRGFEVCIKGLGAFPSGNSPRVLWAGTEKGEKELKDLNEEIERAIVPLGFPSEERFSPHYTIARLRYVRDREGFRKLLDEYGGYVFGCFKADAFYLMKSVLQRDGPVYSVVKEFRL